MLEGIPSLQALGQRIPDFFYMDADECTQEISIIAEELRRAREKDLAFRFEYAEPITNSRPETREEFFSNVILLIERQPDDDTRFAILCLLCELSAIERDVYSGNKYTGSVTDKYAFGKQALQTLRDIMPAVVNIRVAFINCVKRYLVEIIEEMSRKYIIAILPILIDMVKDTKLGYEVSREFVEISDRLVTVFRFCLELLNGKVLNLDTQEGVVLQMPNPKAETDPSAKKEIRVNLPVLPRCAFWNICELMSICAEYSETAAEYDEMRVPSLCSIEKTHLMNNADVPDQYCKECAVHKLMASLARNMERSADHFTFPDKIQDKADQDPGRQSVKPYILSSLLRNIRTVEDHSRQRARKGKKSEHMALHDALMMRAFFGIVSNSGEAARFLTVENQEVNPNTFITNLLKIAKNPDNPAILVAAAMEGLLVIATTKSLSKFKTVMEKECDLASNLQEIMKNLLSNSRSWDSSSHEAIINALHMMELYSQVPEISNQLNDSDWDGYDRESIIFRLLTSKDDSVTDDVKLAAAKALRVVPLTEFDKGEISVVVNMLSSVPSLVSPKTYDQLSNLLFLMFKMSMDGDDSKADDESCGPAFRDIYATEVVSAVFGNIARAMEGDLANAASVIDVRKRKYETACVKFLMTGWQQRQLRQGLDSGPVIETLQLVMVTEQTILTKADPERFQQHEHLFLEQTYVGNDVRTLLKCLAVVKSRDIVAFRLYHQLANVLQGITFNDVLSSLAESAFSTELGFNHWHNKLPCGRSIDQLAARESGQWTDHLDVLSPIFPVVHCDERFADKLADVQVLYWGFVYKMPRDPNPEKWRRMLTDAKTDDRIVHLAMVKGDPEDVENLEIVASIGGGPWRQGAKKDEAELYGLYINSRYLGHRESLQKQMLAHFSHELYGKGFMSCVAWAHDEERGLYDASSAVWMNSPAERKNNPLSLQENSVKPHLFKWDLSQNIWKENTAHSHFLSECGIQTMVHFLTKNDRQTLKEYDPSEVEEKLDISIRGKMEAFGTELMKKLDRAQQMQRFDLAGPEMDLPAFDLTPDGDLGFYSAFLESQFKNPSSGKLLERFAAPDWDSQLSGTAEENFLQTLTLSLDHGELNRPLPPIRVIKPEKRKKKKRKLRKHERVETSLAKFMGLQTNAVCAAMFRAFFVLLKGGTAMRSEALQEIRDPLTFHAIRNVIASVNYGIRQNVLEQTEDEYGLAIKLLRIVEEVIYIHPRGLSESLLAIELYEVLTQVLEDIFTRLVKLIESRNEGSEDPLHRTRSLYRYEELLLSRVCRVTAELLNQVSSIQFFEGAVDVPMIYEGNMMCRLHALRELLGSSTTIQRSVMTFLFYDMEMSSGLHHNIEEKEEEKFLSPGAAINRHSSNEAENDAELARSLEENSSGFHRDMMKIHISAVLGELCSFDKKFRYRFIQEFSRGQAMAEVSLTPSLIQRVLHHSHSRSFRNKLESALVSNGVINEDGEVVVDHSFLTCDQMGVIKLLVCTNRNYYLSNSTFSPSVEYEDHDDDAMLKFTDLHRFQYRMVKRLFEGFKRQVFALERSASSGGVTSRRVHVFLHRVQGVSSRLLRVFSRYCLDDLSQPLPVHTSDLFTLRALDHVYIYGGLAKAQRTRWTLSDKALCTTSMFSFGFVVKGKTRIPRILAWCTAPRGQYLVTASASISKWRHSLDVYDEEAFDKQAKNYLGWDSNFKLDEMESVEFTETSSPLMVIGFKKGPMTFEFAGETAREMWRRKLKQFLADKPDWTSTILPDLYEKDRHTRKYI